jgi:PncC family amidohydrolase
MPLDHICKDAAEILGAVLLQKKVFLSTAESCTGGLIAAAITGVAGSSHWFRGGVVAYDNAVKTALLNVPGQILLCHGAVSEQTAEAMARGVARLLQTECAISVSGIAGPGGGSAEKPVGLVYIGIYYLDTVKAYRHLYAGNREMVREQAVQDALGHLREVVA